jgi:hypothetical protein
MPVALRIRAANLFDKRFNTICGVLHESYVSATDWGIRSEGRSCRLFVRWSALQTSRRKARLGVDRRRTDFHSPACRSSNSIFGNVGGYLHNDTAVDDKRRARHERDIIGGKEYDALGDLIGCRHAADLSGACRRDSFSRSPSFVSLQM